MHLLRPRCIILSLASKKMQYCKTTYRRREKTNFSHYIPSRLKCCILSCHIHRSDDIIIYWKCLHECKLYSLGRKGSTQLYFRFDYYVQQYRRQYYQMREYNDLCIKGFQRRCGFSLFYWTLMVPTCMLQNLINYTLWRELKFFSPFFLHIFYTLFINKSYGPIQYTSLYLRN